MSKQTDEKRVEGTTEQSSGERRPLLARRAQGLRTGVKAGSDGGTGNG